MVWFLLCVNGFSPLPLLSWSSKLKGNHNHSKYVDLSIDTFILLFLTFYFYLYFSTYEYLFLKYSTEIPLEESEAVKLPIVCLNYFRKNYFRQLQKSMSDTENVFIARRAKEVNIFKLHDYLVKYLRVIF